jgi:hypothetical protein
MIRLAMGTLDPMTNSPEHEMCAVVVEAVGLSAAHDHWRPP